MFQLPIKFWERFSFLSWFFLIYVLNSWSVKKLMMSSSIWRRNQEQWWHNRNLEHLLILIKMVRLHTKFQVPIILNACIFVHFLVKLLFEAHNFSTGKTKTTAKSIFKDCNDCAEIFSTCFLKMTSRRLFQIKRKRVSNHWKGIIYRLPKKINDGLFSINIKVKILLLLKNTFRHNIAFNKGTTNEIFIWRNNYDLFKRH